MSVLILADQTEGHFKKTALEALSYGAKLAEQLNTTAEALVLGTVNEDLASLRKYGVKKLHHTTNEAFNIVDGQIYKKEIAEAVKKTSANELA